MKEDLLKIINKYGVLPQLKYFQSEVFELGEAIIECELAYHYSPCQIGRGYEEHIAEEIADVIVMLKQFQHYYNITDEEIEEVMKYKINRQLQRIENEKN